MLRLTSVLIGLLAVYSWGQDTEIQYLSGTGSDDTVSWEFFCSEGRQSGAWSIIEVPSNWELQGFGTYNYGHNRPKAQETGRYRHAFRVPEGWQGKHIELVFDGVMTDTEVWINGASAGPMHQGGFYRFSYDITDLIQWQQLNQLEVLVHKVSHDRSVEQAERQADYWVFGGIFRPVYLKAMPLDHIERCAVDARADGQFLVDVYVSPLKTNGTLTAQITGPGLGQPHVCETVIPAGQDKVTLTTQVDDIKTWTAETPHLYQVELSLQQNDTTLHTLSERFGFRSFEVRPEGLFLNGHKIILQGVNRHCFWPETGRCLNRAQSYADVHLIKAMNMNAVTHESLSSGQTLPGGL